MIKNIKNTFPEFVSSKYYDEAHEELPYVFLGDFSDFAEEQLGKNNNDLVEKFIEFINSVYEGSDDEEKNLVWVGVFEVLGSHPKWHSLLLERLAEPVKTQYRRRFEEGQISNIFD